MVKNLLICTKVHINGYQRIGSQRDISTTSGTRVWNIKGDGVINLKVLRKKILVIEWAETTNYKTKFTTRTKIEIDLLAITNAILNNRVLNITFKQGSARSMTGAQEWDSSKNQKGKCKWLKEYAAPENLTKACATAKTVCIMLHNTEVKIRKELRYILVQNPLLYNPHPSKPKNLKGPIINMNKMTEEEIRTGAIVHSSREDVGNIVGDESNKRMKLYHAQNSSSNSSDSSSSSSSSSNSDSNHRKNGKYIAQTNGFYTSLQPIRSPQEAFISPAPVNVEPTIPVPLKKQSKREQVSNEHDGILALLALHPKEGTPKRTTKKRGHDQMEEINLECEEEL